MERGSPLRLDSRFSSGSWKTFGRPEPAKSTKNPPKGCTQTKGLQRDAAYISKSRKERCELHVPVTQLPNDYSMLRRWNRSCGFMK